MTRALVLTLLASTTHAHAEPQSCAELRPVAHWAQLSTYSQRRFPDGQTWERRHDYQNVIVDLEVDRAPHIARAVLGACPGVHITSVTASDQRSRTSFVELRIRSFAALSLLAQLPAIRSMSAFTPSKIKHPMPIRDPIPIH